MSSGEAGSIADCIKAKCGTRISAGRLRLPLLGAGRGFTPLRNEETAIKCIIRRTIAPLDDETRSMGSLLFSSISSLLRS